VVTREEDAFRVQSRRVERLVGMTPIENSRAVRHLQRRLKALGVEAALSREGAREGDEVRIGEMAFEYLPEER
jgi:GTP-binding protein